MRIDHSMRLMATVLTFALAACTGSTPDCEVLEGSAASVEPSVPEGITGLDARIVKPGRDEAVGTGDRASMHYTGWLFDPEAEDGRGQQFDSSRDRGRTFEFTVGEGRVIRGWDVGVVGMQIGEVRELKIAPELGYGQAGAGAAIPPNSTLLFEVELVSFRRCHTYD
jgi:FKBP-type peptidyl-prolyl cis-trans isomerase FkpA